jgi:DNA-binding GntR family transcriptional regulator
MPGTSSTDSPDPQPGRPAGPGAVTPLHRPSTVDALVAAISALAYAGELRGGEPLREHELADRFDVGRHSVRSALQVLALEGIAMHEQNRGVFVRDFSPKQINDIYLLRGAIETEAVRQIRLHDLPQHEASVALGKMADLPPSAEVSVMVVADLDVHRGIVLDSGSGSLLGAFDSVVRSLRLALAQIEYDHRDPPRLTRQHSKLIADVWSLTPTKAVEEIRAHNAEAVGEVQAAQRRKAV